MMSSDSLDGRPARDPIDRPTSFCVPFSSTGRTGERDRRDPPDDDREHEPHAVTRGTLNSRERARIAATARPVLLMPEEFLVARHAPVIAARTRIVLREPASFVEKFALAEMSASGGIKHGTVRNESTPRLRAASILPITHTTGRQESSSRVTPSRHALLSPMFSTARPSRSDRTSAGCRTSEDQGGPQ
jgi:hypothetical protein